MEENNNLISWSQANTYEQCAKKWAYLKIDGIEGEEQEALKHGKQIHEEIENYLKTGKTKQQKPHLQFAEKLIEKLKIQNIEIEKYLQKGSIRGKADVAGNNILIDWKTSKNDIESMKEQTYNQLCLYAYLSDYKTGDLLVEAYPEKNIYFQTEYDKTNGKRQYERLERIFKDIQETREFICSADDITGTPTKLCGWCPYENICPDNYNEMRKKLKK